MGVLVREAGKTYSNAIAEVREAIDFLYYYAAQVTHDFDNNTHRPLGPVVCISPWNFPLAIFSGQIAAALAAGNTVLAKPAEQTPLIASKAVELFHQAGIPRFALQLLPGQGETIGARLVADERVRGVMFTGSTDVAHILQKTLAGRLDSEGRPVPLIAETGGLNAMIVDSSALTEQVVTDVMASAYDSAGQRCSALRLLCIQEEVADHTIEMLKGAMAQAMIGDPSLLSTDIGPVIDKDAKTGIEKHIKTMRAEGHEIYQASHNSLPKQLENNSTFVQPTLIELDKVSSLKKEIFGPVLHVVRYASQDLPALLEEINATGYGLTMGVHTRIDETIAYVASNAKVGNLYVNRNMVGAVVGVQPFGGEGLSGTGPKAGGPVYLYRLLSKRPENAATQTLARQDEKYPIDTSMRNLQTYNKYMEWLENKTEKVHYDALKKYALASQTGTLRVLPGPTGERNTYQLVPCGNVLCISDNEQDVLTQIAGVLASGCHAIVANSSFSQKTYRELPDIVRKTITLTENWTDDRLKINAVIYHGDSDQLRETCQKIAQRKGAIISVQGFSRGDTGLLLERLLHERALSINTAAAGGNASLMTIS
jgi:RHH-type proline utilization regulon transcriptional repressor/proline dehydrogenase/delta 1-pyrroline-5-carboxylate dehydrogenase